MWLLICREASESNWDFLACWDDEALAMGSYYRTRKLLEAHEMPGDMVVIKSEWR